ncbi:hypothetical protein GLOIN_2v1785666 [Rhizophagus irregularis DAOM 181602=DAOM 197198]|uniref:Uncharacterized protein n=1 Tax=Rhizophagus irregularis (strain DAOM 181602 / DAOM 197198 / MUCL 43194) TaxID=747089 RepID=A0A2P4P9V7_RHIID|nr:hypothetical protein GLOIN_2v1785666 [Rhizophagus irregularis DAOM 181602=DAOM 197198]POG62151.1 hypothetical protein GLOIN_2v1785666 [Rhizophagus irregularis DAOM 181602=DAOM 197198]|eukprot:XP_025169017.1 hypothetical protein GLOIN_2v1785666 [Rhizophagus irregularis DAOM 181602=DAOM 197198]
MFTTEFETITVSSQSSRRSSVTSLSDQDYQDADEFALRECIEIIEANVEEVIIDKADEREKKWWIDGNYKIIGENTRLPLILVEDLPNRDHEVAHGEFTRQFLNALSNVPRQNQVSNTGSTNPGDLFSKQSDASYTPKQLPKPAANSCDAQGNPWPTVIVEIANTQSLPSIIRKTTQFWLAPNRVEDVIILKLWNWNSRRDQNGIPLRCLTVQRSPQNARGDYLPVQTVRINIFMTDDDSCLVQLLYHFIPGMCTLNISPRCMYRGCPRQNPPLPPYPITNNDVIDLHDIQQEIFDNM